MEVFLYFEGSSIKKLLVDLVVIVRFFVEGLCWLNSLENCGVLLCELEVIFFRGSFVVLRANEVR